MTTRNLTVFSVEGVLWLQLSAFEYGRWFLVFVLRMKRVAFVCLKMDITPRKRAKMIALKYHTTMTVRDVASAVGVCISSVSRILTKFKQSRSSSPQRRGKCGRKRNTTPRTDTILVRNSKIHPRRSSSDLQRDIFAAGIHCKLLEAGRKARRSRKNELLTPAMMKKCLAWVKKNKNILLSTDLLCLFRF